MTQLTDPGAVCLHFGECGGCQYQDVARDEQLARKSAHLASLFGAHWTRPIPVEPSPIQWHYRNKVDLNFAGKFYDVPPPKDFVRETMLGYKRKGRWFDPLDIAECRIGPEGLSGLVDSVRAWYRRLGLTAYNTRNHSGFLKILLVRASQRTDDKMVVLVTQHGELDAGAFVDAVRRAYPATSIQWAQTGEGSVIAAADTLEVLHGAGTIDEELHIPGEDSVRKLRFRLSPFSFFQTNTLATEKLYAWVRNRVATGRPRVLYDLYGGSGGIALTCADFIEKAVSVEEVPEATQDGIHNAQVNGVENIEFVTDKVEKYLRHLAEKGPLPDNATVVADPPRAGLHPKALKRLPELAPRRLIYISCKPTVFTRDELPALLEQYAIEEVHAFDLFPHTEHVETVITLERK